MLKTRAVRDKCDDGGYTLIEALFIMAIVTIMLGISMMAFRGYAKSSEYRGAVRETVAVLRNARTRAVSDAVTTQCYFATQKRLEIYRGTGAGAVLLRTLELPANVEYVASGTVNGQTWGFTGSGSPDRCLFYAKGSATGGRIAIRRMDRPSQHSAVEVEALTGRVNYCADPTPATPCSP